MNHQTVNPEQMSPKATLNLLRQGAIIEIDNYRLVATLADFQVVEIEKFVGKWTATKEAWTLIEDGVKLALERIAYYLKQDGN